MAGGASRWWTIGWPIALVLVPVLAFGACVYHAAHAHDDHVAEVARSAEVGAADQKSAAWINDELTRIDGAAPWLRPLGDEVVDKCTDLVASWGGDGFLQCTRDVTRFYGFDGDFVARAKALAGAVSRAGWPAVELTTELRMDSAVDPRTNARLDASWTEQSTPFAVDSDADRGQVPHEWKAVYREVRPLDVTALTNAAFQHHKFVLRIGITDTYVRGLDLAPSTPVAPQHRPTGAPPCYSGSDDCVGG